MNSADRGRWREIGRQILTGTGVVLLSAAILAVWKMREDYIRQENEIMLINETRFTAEEGAALRATFVEFQLQIMSTIAELPPDDWEQRIIAVESGLQDLRVDVARMNRRNGQ